MAHFVIIRNRYGDIVSAHTSLERAQGEVLEYIGNNWQADEMGPIPEDFLDATRIYFEKYGDRENYQIYGVRVQGEPPAAPQEDEVLLNPDEVAVVINALGSASPEDIAYFAGMPRDKAAKLRSSVYAKIKG